MPGILLAMAQFPCVRSQAALVGLKTEDHLIGEVVSLSAEKAPRDSRCYGLIIKAPGLKNYLFPILKITYSLNAAFPILVESRQIKGEPDSSGSEPPFKSWEASNADELSQKISAILSHQTTINGVRTLIAESIAMGYNPKDDQVPF